MILEDAKRELDLGVNNNLPTGLVIGRYSAIDDGSLFLCKLSHLRSKKLGVWNVWFLVPDPVLLLFHLKRCLFWTTPAKKRSPLEEGSCVLIGLFRKVS